ncbi:MAG: translocated intimin receptor Tir [Acidobacteriota bacterium]|nr:translocated intimin receptor Tir [Acidobacteriota bacterium]
MKPSTIRAMLTDVQLWVPVAVLIFGMTLLAVIR